MKREAALGDDAPPKPAARPILAVPEGVVDFEVGAGQAGERLDRFLAARRASGGSRFRAPGSRR